MLIKKIKQRESKSKWDKIRWKKLGKARANEINKNIEIVNIGKKNYICRVSRGNISKENKWKLNEYHKKKESK